MDVHSNAAVPTGSGVPEEPFPTGESTMKGGDADGVSLEWLSVFVEECLNGGGFACQQFPIPPPPPPPQISSSTNTQPTASSEDRSPMPMQKRRRRRLGDAEEGAVVSLESDPLVPQAYWLAESELIVFPKRKDDEEEEREEEERKRRCTHCLSQKTPQWRAGPLGPKTLCNACGVRFKSGRLLPEYRPAKSPTFESYKHSNSHKKIMEMRNNMAATSNPSSRAN
ncbi:GATA transcription factor 5-like [Iris pallida]|uniref:GATA transcription factor 5-like n=1 Tax=Iris pallida TaxID=29817 RepID=A0AAX6GJ38_IRIPA|nr:GATA transcription factor 5-like [Iris pallida]